MVFMLGKEQKENSVMPEGKVYGNDDFEARQNLLGFFSLLLQIDKRINPHLYKKDENN